MPTIGVPIFAAVLWLLVVFAVTALWFVAISEIESRARNDLFTSAQVISMAAAVSIAAVMSVTAAGAVLLTLRGETPSSAYNDSLRAYGMGCGGSRTSFVFSFGLERSIYPSARGTDGSGGEETLGLCRTHG